MTEIYLLLGCNTGNCNENLENACRLIEFRCGSILSQSSIYETEAWGNKEQPVFLNMAVKLYTNLSPENLLTAVKGIELEVGRTASEKWGPREMDIDILLYGNEIIELDELKIPHSLMTERRFSLEPLNEIAADFVHPGLQKTILQLLEECKDNSEVKKRKHKHSA